MNVDGLKEALDELAARRKAAPLIEARMDKIAAERDQYLAAEIRNRELCADCDHWQSIAQQLAEALKQTLERFGHMMPEPLAGQIYTALSAFNTAKGE